MTTRRSITEDLRDYTKDAHAHLNKRIIPLLSHGLPPDTASPAKYIDGMSSILPLFTVMELAMSQVDSKSRPSSLQSRSMLGETMPPPPFNSPASDSSNVVTPENTLESAGPQIASMQSIDASGILFRAKALKADLEQLRLSLIEAGAVASSSPASEMQSAEWQAAKTSLLYREPHRLIAWNYVLYNALLNGGRWIRRQLEQAFLVGWSKDQLHSIDEIRRRYLSFWYFEGEDERDMKGDLRTRLDRAGESLDDSHREQVLDEASWLFQCVEGIIDDITSEATK